MNKIDARDVNFYYGNFHALKGISMQIEEKSVVAFIGPSGCGKSTFLRLFNRMNDLIPDTRLNGEILIDGKNIYDKDIQVDELRKNVGMVFQRPNPFPKSIFENVAYGLRVNGVKDKEFIRNRVEETLKGAALWNEVKEKLMEKPLYFDTSFSGDYLQKEGVSGMLTKEAFVDLIHAMGSDRVLFGTDSPWSGQKDAVQWFMETDLTETEKKKILSDNFIRIIGI